MSYIILFNYTLQTVIVNKRFFMESTIVYYSIRKSDPE